MKKFIAMLMAGAMAFSLAACGNQSAENTQSGSDKTDGSELSGTVMCLGSTSMSKVMGYLSEQFSTDNSGVTVSVEGGGSSAGVEAAANGTADLGLASRALKDEEKEQGLVENIVALDGIAIIVNADNAVADLSVEQIAQLATGEITNWSEVGGNDGQVVFMGREAGSGTRDGFESITGTEDLCVYQNELTSTGEVIANVASNPDAIGYASLSAVEGDATIKALTVGGVAASEETVLDGSYVIQRNFNFIVSDSGELSDAANAFVQWATSAEASDLIAGAGAVPLV